MKKQRFADCQIVIVLRDAEASTIENSESLPAPFLSDHGRCHYIVNFRRRSRCVDFVKCGSVILYPP